MINTKYYFLTNLGIKEGLDSKDQDYLQILPSGILKNFLDGFKELGFIPKGESFTGSTKVFILFLED